MRVATYRSVSPELGPPDLLVNEPKALQKSVGVCSLLRRLPRLVVKIEVDSAVHVSFQELQAVDLLFYLSVAPALQERHPNCPIVPAQAFGEALQLGRVALGSLL